MFAVQQFAGQKLALGGLAARVADQAGRPARHGDGMMAEQLKAPQGQQRHQIADVQAVRSGIKSGVKGDRPRCQPLAQCRRVRAIRHQSAPFQFFKNVHML